MERHPRLSKDAETRRVLLRRRTMTVRKPLDRAFHETLESQSIAFGFTKNKNDILSSVAPSLHEDKIHKVPVMMKSTGKTSRNIYG